MPYLYRFSLYKDGQLIEEQTHVAEHLLTERHISKVKAKFKDEHPDYNYDCTVQPISRKQLHKLLRAAIKEIK